MTSMTHRLKVAGLATALALSAAALAGCAATPEAGPTTRDELFVAAGPVPTSATTASAERATAEVEAPRIVSPPAADTCPPISPLDDSHIDRLIGYGIPVPQDNGPQTYVNGTMTLNEDGVPIAYAVAEGDTPTGIEERTCVWTTFLDVMNSVRRDGIGNLHPGDTINLDAYRVTSVGDQNGAVLANQPRSYIPPQR